MRLLYYILGVFTIPCAVVVINGLARHFFRREDISVEDAVRLNVAMSRQIEDFLADLDMTVEEWKATLPYFEAADRLIQETLDEMPTHVRMVREIISQMEDGELTYPTPA
ncbi:MAG TPA: hypothetical protein VFX17_00525 [Patescibacteria group bacterium]|nr:hypothetical protein [Patescibacteria group bacterium]